GFFLFHLLKEKKLTGKSIWIYLSLIPAIIFYGIQKIKFGWFFYPLHLGLIDDSFKSILAKFEIIIKFLFLNQGRGVLLILVICSIIIYLYRSAKLKSEEKKIIRLIGLIAMIFIIFSVFKFLMLRYLLFLFPLLILIACILFQNVARDKMMYYVGISFILFVGFMYSIAINYKSKEWHDDASINYLNMVKVHKEVVKYCENEDWFNKKIFTHFLMQKNLTDYDLGYLSSTPFQAVDYEGKITSEDEIIIFSCIEFDEQRYNLVSQNPNYMLSKRFVVNKAWSEIFISK